MSKLVFAALAALMMVPSIASAAAPAWSISNVAGRVSVVTGKSAQPARRGATLAAGSFITTGPGARAVLVRGEEFIVLAPSSRLRLPEERRQNGLVQVIQHYGTALFNIEHKSKAHFGVQTQYMVAAVKGTSFTVTVDKGGASLGVRNGAVEVALPSGQSSKLVTAGVQANVSAEAPGALSLANIPASAMSADPNMPMMLRPAVTAAATAGAPLNFMQRLALYLQEHRSLALIIVFVSVMMAVSLAVNARRNGQIPAN